MNVTFACPHCEQHGRQEIAPSDTELGCRHCGRSLAIPADALQAGQLTRCLACPSSDLFVRKDFPQRLGVALVVVGVVGSSITWGFSWPVWTFVILAATALADVVLYLLVPDALMCYRCGAEYRSAAGLERHGAFNLETHERHRQQAARMASQRP